MNCSKCGFYKSCFNCDEPSNICNLLGMENFKEINDCPFINEDGSVNQEELDKSPL